jgi:hypothetical protein
MALWGSRDTFAVTGTAFANSTVNTTILTGTSTVFTTELEVGDTIVVNGVTRKVTAIASNTSLTFEPAWTAANVAGTITGQDTPKFLAANSATVQSSQFANTTLLYGVDANEAGPGAQGEAGWTLTNIYTDMHGNARRKSENLISMNSITGDAEDTVFGDSVIRILTQPSNSVAANNSAVTFTVSAIIYPSANTLSFRWQRAANSSAAFVDLTNTGTFTNTTTATLNIANNTIAAGGGGLSNSIYRCTMSGPNISANVVTANATLTTV